MKSGTLWAWVPVLLLGSSVMLYMVIVPFLTSDPSHAVVPDYEGRAANWDQITAQRRTNKALGWGIRLRAPDGIRPGTPLILQINVHDGAGNSIDDARIEGVALHVARAATRHDFTAHPVAPGIYEATIQTGRAGIWEVDVSVRRGDELFTERRRLSVADASR